jgi:serine phosphatase RsbU (regulator of sigma subunit)
VLPIATPAEVLASLTILSLDPAHPISEETVETALSIAAQAALAIDNARLYQQQKEFADTMQRSLLPREQPSIPGLEVGEVYEGAASVAFAGDVYDLLVLPDGSVEGVVVGGIALGIEPRQTFEEVEIPLPPGALIVLYTDGVIEARRGRELYGVERLDAVLRECRGFSPDGLVRRVVEDCRAFGGELTDDVAVVAIQRSS